MMKKVFCAIMILCMMVTLFACKGNTGTETTEPESKAADVTVIETEEQKSINPLTGLALNNESAEGKRPVAIVMSNAPSARPQWGLCTPDVIFEGVTEGGITRMLCLYSDVNDIPEKFGSVRSARHDFVEIAEGLDAIFVHWGTSTLAESEIANHKVNNIDGMKYSGTYFFRDTTRNVSTEHTGYTTGSAVIKAISKLGFRQEINSAYKNPFKFYSQDTALNGGTCNNIKLVFSSSYVHNFKYNESDKLYYNSMGTTPMKDSEGKQMAVKNLIVVYTTVSKAVGGSDVHRDMDLSSGTGLYIANGTYQEITWKKGSYNSTLKFYDKSGNELSLNTGKSWIGLVPKAQEGSTVIG